MSASRERNEHSSDSAGTSSDRSANGGLEDKRATNPAENLLKEEFSIPTEDISTFEKSPVEPAANKAKGVYLDKPEEAAVEKSAEIPTEETLDLNKYEISDRARSIANRVLACVSLFLFVTICLVLTTDAISRRKNKKQNDLYCEYGDKVSVFKTGAKIDYLMDLEKKKDEVGIDKAAVLAEIAAVLEKIKNVDAANLTQKEAKWTSIGSKRLEFRYNPNVDELKESERRREDITESFAKKSTKNLREDLSFVNTKLGRLMVEISIMEKVRAELELKEAKDKK